MLSHHKPIYLSSASVYKKWLRVFTAILGTDQRTFVQSENIARFASYFEADVDDSLFDKYYLRDFFKFSVKDCIFFFDSRLQILKKLNHKVTIYLILPGVEAFARLWNIEHYFEILEEIFEQIVPVEHVLRLFGKLVKVGLFFRIVNGLVLIILPFVFKVLFY